jgi:hypothetical protein
VNGAETTLKKQTVGCNTGGIHAEFTKGHLERPGEFKIHLKRITLYFWKEMKILEIEINSVCTKYKDAVYMSFYKIRPADPTLKFRPSGTAYSDQQKKLCK